MEVKGVQGLVAVPPCSSHAGGGRYCLIWAHISRKFIYIYILNTGGNNVNEGVPCVRLDPKCYHQFSYRVL